MAGPGRDSIGFDWAGVARLARVRVPEYVGSKTQKGTETINRETRLTAGPCLGVLQ